MNKIITLQDLVLSIKETANFFFNKSQRQINTNLTLRNWVIGFYLVNYEQQGKDRAEYGDKVIERIALNLKSHNIKGLSASNLWLFRQFYLSFPQILQTLSGELLEQLGLESQIEPDQTQIKNQL